MRRSIGICLSFVVLGITGFIIVFNPFGGKAPPTTLTGTIPEIELSPHLRPPLNGLDYLMWIKEGM